MGKQNLTDNVSEPTASAQHRHRTEGHRFHGKQRSDLPGSALGLATPLCNIFGAPIDRKRSAA